MELLHEASRYGHLDVLTFLLDEKSSRNVETKGGKTALDEASLNDHLDIVKFLVDNKADINGKDKRGETPPDQTNLGIHTDVAKYPRSKGRGGGARCWCKNPFDDGGPNNSSPIICGEKHIVNASTTHTTTIRTSKSSGTY